MIVKIILTIIITILSGICGRLGGRKKDGSWYDIISDTKIRDCGCSLLSLIAYCLWFGININYWYVYIIVFGLQWGALTTYWKPLFNFNNLWFSGFVVGIVMLPLIFIDKIWVFFIFRPILLAIIWGCLNKCLPFMVFKWRRDVAEEFLRYSFLILSIGGLI